MRNFLLLTLFALAAAFGLAKFFPDQIKALKAKLAGASDSDDDDAFDYHDYTKPSNLGDRIAFFYVPAHLSKEQLLGDIYEINELRRVYLKYLAELEKEELAPDASEPTKLSENDNDQPEPAEPAPQTGKSQANQKTLKIS